MARELTDSRLTASSGCHSVFLRRQPGRCAVATLVNATDRCYPILVARMIPEELREAESTAERRLFEHLRDDTADQLLALHSVSWLVPTEKGRPRQGEADFVLAHPAQGILVVEVKGGTIRYDADKREWWSTGKEGEHRIKDPFAQATRSTFSLRRLLERSKRVGDDRFFVGHAVVFPDTRAKSGRLKPDAPREIVLDGDDVRDLETSLARVFRYWRGTAKTPPPGKDGVDHLERVLANSFEIRAPLSVELAEEERDLLTLTEEQYRVLDFLSRQTRAAIAGCAGSGKTFLAAEKARRLALEGFRVLVLSFNTLLAQHLRRGLQDVAEIDVYSYDHLCYEIVREAGIELAERPEPGDEHRHYQALRAAFAENVEVAAGRYGALVVDEAQDFDEDWWFPLQLLLQDPDASPLYVFLDDNQRIFPVARNLPVPGEPFQLTVNCRNTKAINELVRRFYRGGSIEARGPAGPPVDLHFYETETELLEQLDGCIAEWILHAEVEPDQIALLTPKGAHRSVLWRVDQLGGKRLTDDPWDDGKILRSSIYRFKGLERLVVAVTELDGARDDVFYVGFSRPNVFLSIFAPESARHRLPRELLARASGG